MSVLSLALAMTACNVIEVERDEPVDNTPAKEVALVPMTFSASYSYDGVDDDESTKTVLDGLSIKWKAGDRIAIFDDVDPSTPHEFIAASNGASTSFTGSVSAGAVKFFAVYPYTAAIDCDANDSGDYVGQMNVNIPSVQTPVEDSFDPAAAVLAAYSNDVDKTFHFKVPFALAKFTVNYDNVYSVSFSSGKNMTGSLHINLKENGSIGTGDGTNGDKFKTLTIRNADNTPLTKGATYYAVMRYRTDGNSYTDFTATVGNTDCGYATKTASAAVPMARATINNLGAFSGMNFTTNRYTGYQDGLDVTIAGNVYNKAADGDAIDLNPENNISDSRITGKVHFLRSGNNYTTSGLAISKDVVIAASDPEERVQLTPSSTWKLNSGSLVLEGVVFDMSPLTSSGSTVSFFNNSGATEDFAKLVLSKCAMGPTENTKPMYLYALNSGKAGYSITDIKIIDCLFRTDGNFQAIINPTSNATAAQNFKSFEYSNNVFYSSGVNVRVQLFTFGGTKSSSTTSDWDMSVKINNNLFYNVANTSGYFKSYNIGSIEVRNNILFATDASDAGGNAKILALSDSGGTSNYSSNTACSDNYAFGVLANSKAWTISDATYRVGNLVNPSMCGASPIDAATNTATGTFVLTDDYDEYGPQPMPLPM